MISFQINTAKRTLNLQNHMLIRENLGVRVSMENYIMLKS